VGEQSCNSPQKFSKTCSVVSPVEYISWLRPCLLSKVIICDFVENHGNPMSLSLQITAMHIWKEMPCVKCLQIGYCVNFRIVILIYLVIATNEAFFCDCYRNTGHFLCSVERIKRFVNVHLHCIVSNVPSKGRKYSGPPELLRSEFSFSRTCNISKQWKLHRKQGAIWMKCVFFRSLIRLYIYYIIRKMCNSLTALLN